MDGPDFEVAAKTRDAASYVAPTPDDDDDLLAEFNAARENVKRRDFDALQAAGVPGDYLWHGAMRFGVAVVEPAGRTYQPSDNGGKLAIVLPADPVDDDHLLERFRLNALEDVGDLIAFRMSRPDRWWARCGTEPILNPLAIDRAEIMHERLTVFSSPLAWLRGSGQGVVILDWSINFNLYFGSVSEGLIADSLSLGDKLQRRLDDPGPPRPQIFVAQAAA